MITGFADFNNTKKYLNKFSMIQKETQWFCTSEIAMGTHLGEMNEEDSVLYRNALEYGLRNGINFIDTAINYRGMRSERDIGYVLTKLIVQGKILNREQIVISSKAGIIPGDIEAKLVPNDYLQQILINNGIINWSDINKVEHHRHVLNPNYYRFAIQQSKKHLQLETIDIYYIHNPEISLTVLGEEEFYIQLAKLFETMEEEVACGNIRFYGFATWLGFLYSPLEKGYLSLSKIVDVAKKVGGDNHHFAFIQFPYNQRMPEANLKSNQNFHLQSLNLFETAQKLGITATTSAPFYLGELITTNTHSNQLLEQILSTKGLHATMIGMKQIAHVKQNLKSIQVN